MFAAHQNQREVASLFVCVFAKRTKGWRPLAEMSSGFVVPAGFEEKVTLRDLSAHSSRGRKSASRPVKIWKTWL